MLLEHILIVLLSSWPLNVSEIAENVHVTANKIIKYVLLTNMVNPMDT